MKSHDYWETNGTHNGQPVYCPVNAIGDCPYCDRTGLCHMGMPFEDCDDFACFFESWEDWEGVDNEEGPEDFSEQEIQWAKDTYGYPG